LRSTDERKPHELEDVVHACWIDHKYSGRSSKRSPEAFAAGAKTGSLPSRFFQPGAAGRNDVLGNYG
jgi:hypothetical protein